MPDVTVYIKKDDLEKWKALPSKTNFIHEALKTVGFKKLKLPQFEKPITIKSEVSFCKSGYVTTPGRTTCQMKDCKACRK